MEPPTNLYPDALRDEQVKIFRSIPPIKPSQVVRGQFTGYRNEPGVAPDSKVETFAAVRLEVDSWRWAGVPLLIRAGKCLPVTATEVLVQLKRASASQSSRTKAITCASAWGPISPCPSERASSGPDPACAPCRPSSPPSKWTSAGELDAYERLLTDAMHGDQLLFVRQDAVEAAWAIVDPILGTETTPLHEYAPGSWGPAEADALAAEIGGWHNPVPPPTGAASQPE